MKVIPLTSFLLFTLLCDVTKGAKSDPCFGKERKKCKKGCVWNNKLRGKNRCVSKETPDFTSCDTLKKFRVCRLYSQCQWGKDKICTDKVEVACADLKKRDCKKNKHRCKAEKRPYKCTDKVVPEDEEERPLSPDGGLCNGNAFCKPGSVCVLDFGSFTTGSCCKSNPDLKECTYCDSNNECQECSDGEEWSVLQGCHTVSKPGDVVDPQASGSSCSSNAECSSGACKGHCCVKNFKSSCVSCNSSGNCDKCSDMHYLQGVSCYLLKPKGYHCSSDHAHQCQSGICRDHCCDPSQDLTGCSSCTSTNDANPGTCVP